MHILAQYRFWWMLTLLANIGYQQITRYSPIPEADNNLLCSFKDSSDENPRGLNHLFVISFCTQKIFFYFHDTIRCQYQPHFYFKYLCQSTISMSVHPSYLFFLRFWLGTHLILLYQMKTETLIIWWPCVATSWLKHCGDKTLLIRKWKQ